jgi:hypothetical protein
MSVRTALAAKLDQFRAHMATPHPTESAVLGAVLLGGLIALDELLFHLLFDSSYLRWYLANGSLAALVFALVTLAWGDVNKLTGLISAHPLEYAGSCLALWTLPGFGLAAILRTDRSRQRPAVTPHGVANDFGIGEMRRKLGDALANPAVSGRLREELSRLAHEADDRSKEANAPEPPTSPDAIEEPEPPLVPKGLGLFDVWLGILFGLTFALVYVAWLLVVAPIQFVVNLLAGAPARVALASPYRAWFLITAHEIHVEEAWKSEPLPKDAVESAFSSKPVTFTAVIAAATLFVVSTLVS